MILDELLPEVAEARQTEGDVFPLFLNRWSPRSFTADAVPEEDLLACIRAAHWAPSSYNEQPWRFIYAVSEKDRDSFVQCLIPFNRLWAEKASVLVALCAKERFSHEDSPNGHCAFDCGAAWAIFALEATRRGYSAHAMAGFDPKKAHDTLKVPDGYRVVCFIALGKRGPKEALPERMRQGETPSGRKRLAEVAFEGAFPQSPYFK